MKKAKKNLKRYIAFLAVLIILVSITVTPAHATYSVTLQRVKAGIAAAILGLNTMISAVGAPVEDAIDYIFSPNQDYYTYFDAWQDRPSIQIWPDYVEIDGVKYTDVWISTDAAEKFRVDAFDFLTEYSIASNTNGTFASGVGHIDGLPLFNLDGRNRTQSIIIPNTPATYNYGNGTINVTSSGSYRNFSAVGSNGAQYTNQKLSSVYPAEFYWYLTNSRTNAVFIPSSGASSNVSTQPGNLPFDQIPFDFDWVSGTIPADQQLPEGTGMMIRIPSEPSGSSRNIIDFVDDNPDFAEPGGTVIDFDLDPDVGLTLDDLFDIIMPLIPVMNFGDIQFIENHTQPAPVINNLLPDTYKQEILQPITETINNQTTTIIENIPQIDEICQNIDSAPFNDLDTGLDKLPTVFAPFILDLRSALGIWHYVTEWLSQISTTFSFITGCLIGTSIMTPIYAAIAGFMCIKIYRRMTG